MVKSPILLITFNRPDTTRRVFAQVKKAQPKKLYVFSDAPRENNSDDKSKVEQVRRIVSQVDWECELFTKFEENNLGCGPGVANAISWIFEHEDRAIILEDDCVPAQSFFYYCEELLERYKDDERVWVISGNNFYEEIQLPWSYIFSNYGHIWGWATWKRCWQHFDIEMKKLPEFIHLGGFENIFLSKKEGKFFNKMYTRFMDDSSLQKHTWDYQANFMVKCNNGLSIVPARNLVKNIGIVGTHSSQAARFHNRPVDESFQIKSHPPFIFPYKKHDQYHFQMHYAKPASIGKRIVRKIAKIISFLR